MTVPLSTLALITFLVPLWGIHQRLVDEKERCLGESSTRMTNALGNFRRAVETNAAEQALQNKDLVAALEYEYNLYSKVPTWPWQPDTFRLIISALLLPFVLFVVQFVMQRLLAP
jgi:hypothetical protein